MPSFSTQTTRSPLALALALALLFAAAANVAAQQPSPQPSQTPASAPAAAGLSPHRQLLRDIYRQLIEINTTDSAGSTTEAAEAMAARLRAAGFPASDVQVLVPAGNARKGNLVARLRSTAATTRKPLLLLAHIDVVEARKEDWSNDLDPFRLTEREGFFYGRGAVDDKAMAAIFVANLIRYKQEGYAGDRDLILALTADEEGGDFNGVEWLIKNHRQLVDAEFGINEGGGGRYRQGVKLFNGVQASEKVYQSFRFEVRNKGGHSSLPVKDNAISHLAGALDRLAKHDFPVNLNEVTRAYFERMADIVKGQEGADMKSITRATTPDPAAVARLAVTPAYNSLMRTTCVATRIEGGHADNALPQLARATVNCRILPQETAAGVHRMLQRIVDEEQVSITFIKEPKPSPPSPLTPAVMQPIETLTRSMWPNVPVIPIMSTGATDSLFFRQANIPMYGVSGLFTDIDDNRTHGRDERLSVQSLYDSQEFLYRLVKTLAGAR